MEDETEKAIVSAFKDRWAVVCIISVVLLLLILTNIPLLYGYLHRHPDLKFMGIVAGVRDANIYFMMMVQGKGWSPVLENLFRPGEPNAIYHGFFWFFLGKLSSLLGMPHVAMFHVARIVAVIAFVPALYAFLCRFLNSSGQRLSTLLLVCFGGGAGWLMMLFYHRGSSLPFIPHDIEGPEATAFYTHMTFPHVAFSLVLMVLCMLYIWDAVDSGKLPPAVRGGVCGLILGFIHVINLVVLCVALALFMGMSLVLKRHRESIRPLAVFGSFSLLPIAYYLYIMLAKPGLLPVGAVRSPSPPAYLVGFAPLLLASLLRVVSLVRRRSLPQSDLFLLCWVVGCSLLLYSYPILSQEERAVLGLQVPLAVLSMRALFWDILPGRRSAVVTAVVGVFIMFTLPSSLYNIYQRIERIRNSPEAFSLTHDEYEALHFLESVPGMGIVLSSSERLGLYIPRIAHKRAWTGQYNYPSYARRLEFIKDFFLEPAERSQYYRMLKEHDIDFIFYGPHERSLVQFQPERLEYLEKMFRNATVDIYRVGL
jgi:hypothetical protein